MKTLDDLIANGEHERVQRILDYAMDLLNSIPDQDIKNESINSVIE